MDSRIIIDDISDHLPTILKLNDLLDKTIENKTITSRNLNKKNLMKIQDSLRSTDWSTVITEDVDESFESFHNALIETVDKYAPIVTRKIKNKTYRKEPWLMPSILRSINIQKRLYVKSIKADVRAQEIVKYKNYKKTLDKLKRFSKNSYYYAKCIQYKNNSKKLWELINKVIGKTTDKSSIISYIRVNDIDIINEKEIAMNLGSIFPQ